MAEVHLIGVPLDLGAGRRGPDMGPSALRLTGLARRLTDLGHKVTDFGNVHVPIPEAAELGDPSMRYADAIAAVCEQLSQRTRQAVASGVVPLTLGGDHSAAMGSISGIAAARAAIGPIGCIWVDAHADMNSPESSPSGNVHGMPLAALLGRGPDLLTRIGGSTPSLLPTNTVLFGIRDLDEREKGIVRDSGVTAITMSHIDRDGIGPSVQRAIQVATAGALASGAAGLHISLDMDGIDPSIAPGVGTPVPGGLSYREAHLLMEMVHESGALIGMDLVETNPALDRANATAELGAQLALSALGHRIL